MWEKDFMDVTFLGMGAMRPKRKSSLVLLSALEFPLRKSLRKGAGGFGCDGGDVLG